MLCCHAARCYMIVLPADYYADAIIMPMACHAAAFDAIRRAHDARH